MKVIIQKSDLDTCLTAMILGVTDADNIVVLRGEASDADLMNPQVLCIEAGGSGLVDLNNFDHHDPHKYFPPACKQAYDRQSLRDDKIARLVEYICMVDDRIQEHPAVEFPSLSNIFSGMLLVEKNPLSQLLKGIGILKRVLEDAIDPFATMPDIEEWRPYKAAKEENQRRIEEVLRSAEFYDSASGLKIGFMQSGFIGGIGALYAQRCDVVVMFNPAFGEPPMPKYTIAGNNKKVSHLIECFDKIETGWGGRETIIGSPREGTRLPKEKVIEIVIVYL